MAGYTDRAMRAVCSAKGASLTYTEVVQAVAVARRVPVTMHALTLAPGEAAVAGHIYGSDVASMAAAARVLEDTGNFVAIDINCGCPVRKIVAKGAGAALMAKPNLIAEIVRAVKSEVSLPVTVKTRLGLSPEKHNIETIADLVQQAGADALAVHARYASARHSGAADWRILAHIKRRLDIPLIANGGIIDAAAASEILAVSRADAVMIGRGAVGNPWIFEQIRALWSGGTCPPPCKDERLKTIGMHLELLHDYIAEQRRFRRPARYTPERTACLKFRGHLVRYLSGRKGIKDLMRQIDGIYTVDGLLAAVQDRLSVNTHDEISIK